MKQVILKTEKLKKNFTVGEQEIEVLKGIDLEVYKGDFVIIFGPSGCGKSTLLHTLLGLEEPTAGRVLVDDNDFYAWDEDGRADFRKSRISTVFQQPLWIRSLSVLDNVAFPLRLLGISIDDAYNKANQMLTRMGMEEWIHHLPMELSAGQQQKTSLARSLVIDPLILAADEPTGNLDTSSGEELMKILQGLSNDGRTILMITHDLEYLKYGTKLLHILDGRIVEEYDQKVNGIKVVNDGKKYLHSTSELSVHDPDFIKKLKSD